MDAITQQLKGHYAGTFAEHGCTARGVDWGTEESCRRRNLSMLALIQRDVDVPNNPSLLDVGCGYGQLFDDAKANGVQLRYHGIDVVPEMVAAASERHPDATFKELDIFDLGEERYDYLVCNGILTQKLTATSEQMKDHAKRLITKLFAHCERGVAFNVMSTRVNFMADNLFYWDPAECVAFLQELSPAVGLSHHHLPFEYTAYVYRPLSPDAVSGGGGGA